MHLEQEQQEPPAIAFALADERIEERGRRQGDEVIEHTPQQGVLLGDLGELPEPFEVQVLVPLAPRRFDRGLLDPLVRGQLLGQVEHGHALGEGALVQPLDRCAHQLLVTLVDLDGVLGLRHQPPHRFEGAVRAGRQRLPSGSGGRHPGGRHLAERVENVLRRHVEAEAAQAVEVLVELLVRLGMARGDGERPRRKLLPALAGLRDVSFHRFCLEALEQERDAAQAAELVLADRRASRSDEIAAAGD